MNAEKIHGENVYVNLDEVIETVYQCRRDEANDEWVKRWFEPLASLPTLEVSEDYISREDAVNALLAYFIPQTYTGEQVEQASKLARKIMADRPSVLPKERIEE